MATALLLASKKPNLDAPDEESQDDDEEPNVGFMQSDKQRKVGAFGLAAIAFNALALMSTMSPFIMISLTIAVISAVLTMWNELIIANTGSLRYYINMMRQQAGRLGGENDKLSASNDKLVEETDGLKKIEAGLNDVVSRQGGDMDKFMGLLEENKATLKAMKRIVDLIMYQNLMGFVIDADLSFNHTIDSGMEVDLLICRLEAFDFFDINEESMRKLISDNNGDIYDIVTDIVDLLENGNEEEMAKFITKKTDAVLDAYHEDKETSIDRSDVENDSDDAASIIAARKACQIIPEDSNESSSDDSSDSDSSSDKKPKAIDKRVMFAQKSAPSDSSSSESESEEEEKVTKKKKKGGSSLRRRLGDDCKTS
mmetsp:Transcript_38617/g.44992  ORF Transcript_38617/g.44992 Transcript_38617/m.44992 type:complete len:369 (+) Transcript_38617:112-1218(+)